MIHTDVCILGAGITGCVAACLLADRGLAVTLIDRRQIPMEGASRWNEGKIHLGYTYVGASSLDTQLLMQEGAAVFESLIERVTGLPLPEDWFTAPIVYLVDDDSMEAAETLWARTRSVADILVRQLERDDRLARYGGSGAFLQHLDPEQAALETGQTRIAAAWRTTERAIAPRPVADRICAAVLARPIDFVSGTVTTVRPLFTGWEVALKDGRCVGAKTVVNALWENRALLDRRVQIAREPISIRYKYSLFGRHLTALGKLAPSTRILGRYGDITPYGNGDAYLSWYPAGLAALSDDGTPPALPTKDRERLITETLRGLDLDRNLMELPTAQWDVEGGYVVAQGYGDIDRLESPLHRRHTPDAQELAPGFISADTGKYSLGPLIGERVMALVCKHLGIGDMSMVCNKRRGV